jgi:hypothetical protein
MLASPFYYSHLTVNVSSRTGKERVSGGAFRGAADHGDAGLVIPAPAPGDKRGCGGAALDGKASLVNPRPHPAT